MSLILSLGSNLGDKWNNLSAANKELAQHFQLIAKSRVYRSLPVDYIQQPIFYNQILEFELPNVAPDSLLQLILQIELKLGRIRGAGEIKSGPRVIDIDIIFYGFLEVSDYPFLVLPHPAWKQRSFVLRPLRELPFSKVLDEKGWFPAQLPNNVAFPVS
ncbi:MAG: 2-amino-4-hydroxy-6-hydroxymethyldihydropteridine diphosphokinase [Oligoflexia bacterium]|nr:2-amino-4-hydroxy-6-hydroxymethyldihydropteridine diphosphokinase [Oligoflexia bacterium]